MVIAVDAVTAEQIKESGSGQLVFKRTCSERVQKAIRRFFVKPEFCLEHAHAEMKAYEKYKDEPRIIQRARVFETYLREKTIFILEDELIVGNVTSKMRGSPMFGELYVKDLDLELDDPVMDPTARKMDTYVISPEERKELREVILPYFKKRSFPEFVFQTAGEELKEKSFTQTSSCRNIPNYGELLISKDIGHQMANYEKVLHKGMKGIKREAEEYLAQLDQPYMHFDLQQKRDFYMAVIICLDAAMAYAKRYADLARKMASKEIKPKRKKELERIAEICDWVPANPARDWWEAVQSVWFSHMLIWCEFCMMASSFHRYDQYMYPFYKKSVLDKKTMTRDEALELVELFFVKLSEYTEFYSYWLCQQEAGFGGETQSLGLAGQTRDGKDAVNDVSWLCLEADEEVGLYAPDIQVRVWEGTPQDFLKRCAKSIRLGRGKPKFYGDRKAIQMVGKAYPNSSIEDLRDYGAQGCVELCLPGMTMIHSYTGLQTVPRLLELALYNGTCNFCGKQIGPSTGDPRSFESINGVKQAFREQVFYWMKFVAKGTKHQLNCQAKMNMAPYSSALTEGPLQKGVDLVQGGAWHTLMGLWLVGLADTADSLGVIDKLIYRDKKATWDQLLAALKANWEGYEDLRQLCINGVPKYGNDDDFADGWTAWVMDTWYDAIDWINTQEDLKPYYGGKYVGSTIVGNAPVGFGYIVGALPSGHKALTPLADTMSPVQGVDRKGPTAVIKSVAKLPTHRYAMGVSFNQRLSPELMATDRDLDNWVAFVRSFEEMGLYHIQFNVVSSELLRKALKDPDKYRDLLIRVASYIAFYVELDPNTQLDVINRTEQHCW